MNCGNSYPIVSFQDEDKDNASPHLAARLRDKFVPVHPTTVKLDAVRKTEIENVTIKAVKHVLEFPVSNKNLLYFALSTYTPYNATVLKWRYIHKYLESVTKFVNMRKSKEHHSAMFFPHFTPRNQPHGASHSAKSVPNKGQPNDKGPFKKKYDHKKDQFPSDDQTPPDQNKVK